MSPSALLAAQRVTDSDVQKFFVSVPHDLIVKVV
jgi:hypothetical protein